MKIFTASLSNGSQQFYKHYYKVLTILDMLISLLIVSPAVIGYWRSLWGLMDIFILPDNPFVSAAVSLVIGVCGQIFFSACGKLFMDNFHLNRSRTLFYVVSRTYTVCSSFVCISSWRGLWYLLDLNSTSSIFMSTVSAIIILIVIRGLKNISSSPCVITTDGAHGYFDFATMFRISVSGNNVLFLFRRTNKFALDKYLHHLHW